MEGETVVTAGNLDKRAEETNNKKKSDRINILEKSSTKKRRETERSVEKKKNIPETWSRVVGRRARKQSTRDEESRKGGRTMEKEKLKNGSPLKP